MVISECRSISAMILNGFSGFRNQNSRPHCAQPGVHAVFTRSGGIRPRLAPLDPARIRAIAAVLNTCFDRARAPPLRRLCFAL